MRVVEFELERGRYAVPESVVVELAARVAVTDLPGAPEAVRGLVRVRGELAVAVDLRARLGLAHRPPLLADHLVVVRTPRRLVALEVDRVTRLCTLPGDPCLPVGAPRWRGAVEREDGLVLIVDVEQLLDLEEEARIDGALAARDLTRG